MARTFQQAAASQTKYIRDIVSEGMGALTRLGRSFAPTNVTLLAMPISCPRIIIWVTTFLNLNASWCQCPDEEPMDEVASRPRVTVEVGSYDELMRPVEEESEASVVSDRSVQRCRPGVVSL